LKGAAVRDLVRLAGLFAGRYVRIMRSGVTAPFRLIARLTFQPAERLLIAPQDIRTGDPTTAADIYEGYFAFGGKIVNAHGRSPFEIDHASDAWVRSLASFSWLRHLRADGSPQAGQSARALIDDFLQRMGKPTPIPAWEARVVARRTLSWLSQSPLILEGADRLFYHRFMKGLAHARMALQNELNAGLQGETRLFAALALAELDICAATGAKPQRRSTKILGDELDRQILADGGHISRNPQVLIDLLLDLLPLRQVYAARSVTPPPQLISTIERSTPALRMFRHGDGPLALFNGMGVTAPETLATVLAYDNTRTQTPFEALASGYQRLEAEGIVVLIDAGGPPPKDFSQQAHAGCLAFEMSSHSQPIIINCGNPGGNRPAAREAARTTAAHSTLTLDDTSSCRFALHAGLSKWLGDQILSGPDKVPVERKEEKTETLLRASHNGYQAQFGILHERTLTLTQDGRSLSGRDVLKPAPAAKSFEKHPYHLRFHIHPGVRLSVSMEAKGLILDVPDGSSWTFEAPGCDLAVAESVFFASPDGPRRCEQIVISGNTRTKNEVSWRLVRHDPNPQQAHHELLQADLTSPEEPSTDAAAPQA